MDTKRNKKSHLAIYGNVTLRREHCSDCQTFGFVIDGEIQCCGKKIDVQETPTRFKRITSPEDKRRLPPKSDRDEQLELQENKCFYCELTFGSFVIRGLKSMQLIIEWDHQIPYALTQDNNARNFVAACQVCNGIKTDYVFQTVEEAKLHVHQKRKAKGYV